MSLRGAGFFFAPTSERHLIVNDQLDTEQAAALLGIGVPTLANWRWLGQGPSWTRHRGRVFYERSELLRFLASR